MSIFLKVLEFEKNWYKYSKEEQKTIIASFRSQINNVNKRISYPFATAEIKAPTRNTSLRAINTQAMANNYFSSNHINN